MSINLLIISIYEIGKYTLIGAGAMVTGDVPNHALVIGNPGRVIGWVNKKGEKLVFGNNGVSTCGKFRLKNDVLINNH